MLHHGPAFSLQLRDDGIAQLSFDLTEESVNKFNKLAIKDLAQALAAVQAEPAIKGLIITSSKPSFVVGADITEFRGLFAQPENVLLESLTFVNLIFSQLEDLPMPTVACINGTALGGGFELCLACDYRVADEAASIGLPEVRLGIYPGWGGTVRLPRLIGLDNGVEWIAGGKAYDAYTALKTGAVDAVVATESLVNAAVQIIEQALAGKLDYQARKAEKFNPITLSPIESMLAFESCKAMVKAKAGTHMPAPLVAVKTMQKHAALARDEALQVESKGFVTLAKTDVCDALVGLFLNDQWLKKQAKKHSDEAHPVERAAVIGAGIMGGGIAYQSAYKGTQVVMKDVALAGLELGLSEASKLLAKRVKRGRMTTAKMASVLNRIVPTLNYSDFETVDIAVEAVVEDAAIKKAVLAEAEAQLSPRAVLCSNTSTIAITELAKDLKRPERFAGMHFFNPVHRMPLVEVIRGRHTDDATVATIVQYARKMGKTPIVVNDCPGFLVNRVLFPYFAGFTRLLQDGADFAQIDAVMERFGWPMGPAYLLDVVGIDTAVHAQQVMAKGYPDRMKSQKASAINALYEHERFGQKSGLGFYQYQTDRKGKPKKMSDPSIYQFIGTPEHPQFDQQHIIERMMIPLCLETVRALEDGVVATVQEADMALVLGIGFPPFLGGALKYIDNLGVANFVALADSYAHLHPLYEVTGLLRAMAAQGDTFYPKH